MTMLMAFGRIALGGAAFVALAGLSTTASAQTAADLNRANQALAICSSPAGAAIPECAGLKSQLGVGAPAAAPGGGAAGLLGALAGARGGNAAGVAGVLGALANTAAAKAAPAAGSGDYYVQSANATQAAAGSYHACVAANPTNWQPCLAHLNGGVPVAVAAAPAAGAPAGLSAAAAAGYNRCITSNPGQEAKCAAAYGAVPGQAAGAAPGAQAAAGANAIANAASAAQTARQLAPTVRALGSLLGR